MYSWFLNRVTPGAQGEHSAVMSGWEVCAAEKGSQLGHYQAWYSKDSRNIRSLNILRQQKQLLLPKEVLLSSGHKHST